MIFPELSSASGATALVKRALPEKITAMWGHGWICGDGRMPWMPDSGQPWAPVSLCLRLFFLFPPPGIRTGRPDLIDFQPDLSLLASHC